MQTCCFKRPIISFLDNLTSIKHGLLNSKYLQPKFNTETRLWIHNIYQQTTRKAPRKLCCRPSPHQFQQTLASTGAQRSSRPRQISHRNSAKKAAQFDIINWHIRRTSFIVLNAMDAFIIFVNCAEALKRWPKLSPEWNHAAWCGRRCRGPSWRILWTSLQFN